MGKEEKKRPIYYDNVLYSTIVVILCCVIVNTININAAYTRSNCEEMKEKKNKIKR